MSVFHDFLNCTNATKSRNASHLFQSIMVDGKKMLLKNLRLPLAEEKILELRVEYEVDDFGIR